MFPEPAAVDNGLCAGCDAHNLQSNLYRLARKLHADGCRLNHRIDECWWNSEKRRDGTEIWTEPTHAQYLKKATAMHKALNDVNLSDFARLEKIVGAIYK